MATKKKTKPKKAAIELTLWNVILSYPDVANPKPYKGKIYYSTDVLFDKKHPDLRKLQEAINEVCTSQFGDDESEWPTDKIVAVIDGSEREDSKGYKGRKFIKVKTQSAVPVVDIDENEFNPKNVRGGMFANVAVRVSAWEFDGDEGVAVYLQGIQIDTDKEALNFGGGRSVSKMFTKGGKDESSDDGDSDDEDEVDADEDEDDEPAPRRSKPKSKVKSKKRPPRDEDDEDESDDEDFDSEDDEE